MKSFTLGYLFLSIGITGLFIEFDRVGPLFYVPFLAVMAALSFDKIPLRKIKFAWRFPKEKLSPQQALIGLLGILPVMVYFFATWFQEFPFSGDNYHHLVASGEGVYFWKRHFILALALGLVCWRVFKKKPTRLWPVYLTVVLIAWSFWGNLHLFHARFPGTFYFLAWPLNGLWSLFEWSSPLNPNRLTNVLALLSWLFVLRPIVLKKWPGWEVLPFCFFYFWQKDHLYLFTSSSLEPWGCVLLMLSVESVLQREERLRTLAPFLAVLAALVKENAILALPFIWLAAQRPLKKEAFIEGVIALVPFLFYFLFRKSHAIFRGFDLIDWATFVSPERTTEFWSRWNGQWEFPGMILFAGVLLALIYKILRDEERRFLWLAFLAGFFVQVAFYYSDEVSKYWIGYPRFHLFALILVGSVFFATPKKWLPALSLIIGTIQLWVMAPAMADAFKPDPFRNAVLHYDTPQYYPLKTLVNRSKNLPKELIINLPIGDATTRAYPQLNREFRLIYPYLRGKKGLQCSCEHPGEAIFLPVLMSANLTANRADEKDRKRAESCAQQLKETCRFYDEQRLDGRLTGALAHGVRTP